MVSGITVFHGKLEEVGSVWVSKDMKSVKDYIFELDTTLLVDTFFEEYGEKLYDLYYRNTPANYDDLHIDYDESVRNLPVYDYAQAERKQIYDLIKYLKEIEISECSVGMTGIIYAYSKYDYEYYHRWQARLLFREELLSDPENCPNRSFSGVPFSEVMGFLVADNEYTQNIICDVITFVLYMASSTGYRQENLGKFRKAYKKHNGKEFVPYEPIDEKSLHCIREDQGINCNETAKSQKRLNDVRKAIYEYEMYTMKRERNILLSALKR